MRLGHAILIINFTGIGNGFCVLPLLRRLEIVSPGVRYYHTDNPIFRENTFLESLGLSGFQGTVPPEWRRFDRKDWSAINTFLKSAGIGTVINLRNEGPFRDTGYFEFQAQLQDSSTSFWNLDFDSGFRDEHPASLLDSYLHLFTSHGMDLAPIDPGWLRNHTDTLRQPISGLVVGIFTGASQSVKRWPAFQWISLGRELLKDETLQLRVYSGQSQAERSDAAKITAELQQGGGDSRCTVVSDLSLQELSCDIAGLGLLISNDTFAVHLASALCVPVLGLYFSTDSAIWGGWGQTFQAIQSPTGLSCPLFKPDAGNCTEFYGSCPGPCKQDITPSLVYGAALQILQKSKVCFHEQYVSI